MTKKANYRLGPLKLPKTICGAAWAYEDGNGVAIYVQVPGVPNSSLVTKISRAQILAYVKRDAEVRAARQKKAAAK